MLHLSVTSNQPIGLSFADHGYRYILDFENAIGILSYLVVMVIREVNNTKFKLTKGMFADRADIRNMEDKKLKNYPVSELMLAIYEVYRQ